MTVRDGADSESSRSTGAAPRGRLCRHRHGRRPRRAVDPRQPARESETACAARNGIGSRRRQAANVHPNSGARRRHADTEPSRGRRRDPRSGRAEENAGRDRADGVKRTGLAGGLSGRADLADARTVADERGSFLTPRRRAGAERRAAPSAPRPRSTEVAPRRPPDARAVAAGKAGTDGAGRAGRLAGPRRSETRTRVRPRGADAETKRSARRSAGPRRPIEA